MKKILSILFLAQASWAACPLYQAQNPQINQENQNLCQQIVNPVINYGSASSFTVTSLSVSTVTISSATITQLRASSGTINSFMIVGATSGSSASSGRLGEVITSAVTTSQSSAGNNVYGDLTSIALSPGNWLIYGTVIFNTNQAAAVTECDIGISPNSGDTTTGLTEPTTALEANGSAVASNDWPLTFTPIPVSLSVATTYYLKYRARFGGTNPKAVGVITAVRAS